MATDTTKAAWKKRKVHEGITLPSGAVVDVTLPNLPQMLKAGQIPNPLVEKALKAQNPGQREVTKEALEELWEFYQWLIPQVVVKPEIAEADVPELPIEDIELLVSMANRQTDMDAVGHHLGGLETQKSFRDFRGIITTDPALFGQ